MSDSPPPPPPVPPGGYGAPPAGPPATQAGWAAGGAVPPPPGGAVPPPPGVAPPPSGGGGARPLIIALVVVFGLAALVVVAAVALIVVSRSDNDAPTVSRTTLPSATAPTSPPGPTTTDGARPGDSALDPDETTTTAAAAPADEISVFDVRVGDCFDVPTSGNITNVNRIDCGDPHGNEVFAIFDIAGDDDAPYPGDASVRRRAQRRCTGRLFTEYVGAPFNSQTQFSATSINPTRLTWESAINDREVICVITSPDETPLTRSAQGAQA